MLRCDEADGVVEEPEHDLLQKVFFVTFVSQEKKLAYAMGGALLLKLRARQHAERVGHAQYVWFRKQWSGYEMR